MASDFVLVPYGPAFLRLTQDEFDAAMRRGLAPCPSVQPAPAPLASEPLLDSKAMGEQLSTTADQVETLAKIGKIPSIRVGRYVRFSPSAVIAALAQDGGPS